MPAELSKGDDGEWRIKGLASTEDTDRQGEILVQKGLNLSAITEGKGILNWEHDGKNPESILGSLDSYQHTDRGLIITGSLFKHHPKAIAVHAIMKGLKEMGKNSMGLSVEGSISERDPKNPKIIKKATITAVALTLAPVNNSTHCELMKSMSAASIDFNAMGTPTAIPTDEPKVFTANQMVDILTKALAASSAYATEAPAKLTNGDALAQEEMKDKPKQIEAEVEPKKLKKGDAPFFKSTIKTLFDKIAELYPTVEKSVLWSHIKDRLNKKFPDVQI